MTLSTTLTATLKATQIGGNDFGGPSFKPTMQANVSLTDGTTSGKADLLFMDQRTVSASSNDDIDLGGALTDFEGATITAAEIVAVFIINAPTSGAANTTDLTIGNGTNAFEGFLGGTSPTIGPIKPAGFVMIGAGDAAGIGTVSAGSEDVLRVANSAGASATYQIGVVARTA